MIPGVKGNYQYEIDGDLTFYGVLDKYYEEISVKWSEETKVKYGREYAYHILRHFNSAPLKKYNKLSDYEDVINAIEEGGTIRNKEKKYSESNIDHYRFIIKIVVDVGAKHGECESVLWGTRFAKQEDAPTLSPDPTKQIEKMRCYLTAAERIRILKEIFSEVLQHGVKFALLLMDIFGLRNKEACGALFGDIMEIPDHPGCHVLVVYKSTKGRTRKAVLGGKTDNMYRMMPIPPLVYEFLMARKRYIETLLEEKNKTLPKNKQYKIEQMPIACNGDNFWEACTSVQVTNAGRKLFFEIGFSENAFLFAEEQSGHDDSGYPQQKSPTAYIFRRNYCTDLYVLGYSEEHKEYLMGHKINNPAYSRPHLRNDEQLILMYQKMLDRPLNGDEHIAEKTVEASNHSIFLKETNQLVIRIPCDGTKHRIRVISRHLSDSPTININVRDSIQGKISIERQIASTKPADTVCAAKSLQKTYNREFEKLIGNANPLTK